MLGLAANGFTPPTAPTVTAVTVGLEDFGTCSGTHAGTAAKVRATATLNFDDAANFSVNFYKDGVFKSSVGAASGAFYDYTVSGYVAGVSGHSFISAYVFRADVVRNSSGDVVSTKTASTFREQFGDCSGPA